MELDKNHIERVIQPSAELRQGSDARLRLDEIGPPNNYIFVWGIAYYDDGYGHRRFTRFCHRYKTDSMNVIENAHAPRTVSIIDADKGRYHETGNNAD